MLPRRAWEEDTPVDVPVHCKPLAVSHEQTTHKSGYVRDLKPPADRFTVQVMFDDLADVYEAMIDWPKRLAHEEPFYRRLFERLGARSVLDVACGTGRHAAMFHGWGLRVEGADLSPAMIDRAGPASASLTACAGPCGRSTSRSRRPNRSTSPCAWATRSVLAPDMATVHRAIRQMLAAVRGGGAIVIQVLNLWHLPDGPCVWQKCRRATCLVGQTFLSEKGTGSICATTNASRRCPPQGRSGKWCLSPFPARKATC